MDENAEGNGTGVALHDIILDEDMGIPVLLSKWRIFLRLRILPHLLVLLVPLKLRLYISLLIFLMAQLMKLLSPYW
jgi:hypothetical protein